MCPDQNEKIHSAKSRKESQKSHFTLSGIPSCLVAERVFPSIYSQHWQRVSIWQKVPIGRTAAPLPQSPVNYTIAAGWQEERPSPVEERRDRIQRPRNGEKKGKRQQRQCDRSLQRLLSLWLHSLKHAVLCCLSPSPSPSLGKSWLAAGVA